MLADDILARLDKPMTPGELAKALKQRETDVYIALKELSRPETKLVEIQADGTWKRIRPATR